jgi:hypothetical protein
MAEIRFVHPAKPVCGILYRADTDLPALLKALEARLRPVQGRTGPFAFDFTDYYGKEMGDSLLKCFVSFEGLMQPSELPEWKLRTQALEAEAARDSRRTVNLDPGYITAAKLVLASTKDFAHRIFIGSGIYGDVQLRYRDDAFRPLEWTYPDYRTPLAIGFFQKVRDAFLKEERTHA